jgi:hypothetical protein
MGSSRGRKKIMRTAHVSGVQFTFVSLHLPSACTYRPVEVQSFYLMSSGFWDLTPYIPLNQPTFRRNMSPPSSGSKPSKKPA